MILILVLESKERKMSSEKEQGKFSQYYENLNEVDKKDYKKKLTLSNGTVLPDPYGVNEDWVSDVTRLPDIGWPDIYNYLIETPSEFTKDKLKVYKSLEAYNFFVSGHVHDVFYHDTNHDKFCCIKTNVLPSQRQGQSQTLYNVWVIIHADGWIQCGNCTCMAGLGSACSHVAALLFKLHACTQLELNKVACTSKLCEWKKARKRAYPAPLKSISFKRPKKDDKIPNITSDGPFEGTLTGYSTPDPVKFCTEKQKERLLSLKKLVPKAVLFTSCSIDLGEEKESSGSSTDTADETEDNTIPELLTSFFDPTAINITNSEKIVEKGLKIYKNYEEITTKKQYENLTELTLTQSSSDKWMLYRAGRITASNCKKAFTIDFNKPAKSTINSIMHYNDVVETEQTKHGKVFEATARERYILENSHHSGLKVNNTGLHVNEKYAFLGASPDGLVSCDCHGKRLLEIKCPFKFKDSLSGWKSYENCPIKDNNTIKTSHEYYHQMQLQMLVTETESCDFFVWSEGKNHDDIFQLNVVKDNEFCNKLLEKLEKVFIFVILPELITRKLDPTNKQTNKLYCYCKRPSFQPMIACTGLSCSIGWFHYACVHLKRAPSKKKPWLCPDCQKKDNCK